MIEKQIEELINNGCQPIEKHDFSVALTCGNSIVVKSPNTKWSVLVPAPDLDSVQKRLISSNSHKPQSIEIGEYIQRGSIGKVYDFSISDEIKINNNHDTLIDVEDEEIKKQHGKIEDIKKVFASPTNTINIQKHYEKEINILKDKYNDFEADDLKKRTQLPVVCDSETFIYKHFNSLNGEFPVYKIHTKCIVPKTKQKTEAILDKSLQAGHISEYDIRYLNSKLTDDKSFILSGITLFQKGSNTPFLNFMITDEKIMQNPSFLKKIQALEKKFNSEKSITKLNEDVFTKFLY